MINLKNLAFELLVKPSSCAVVAGGVTARTHVTHM